MYNCEKKFEELRDFMTKILEENQITKHKNDCEVCTNKGVNDDLCKNCDGVVEFIHNDNEEYKTVCKLYDELCDKVGNLHNKYETILAENEECQKEVIRLRFLLECEKEKLEESTEYCQTLLKKLGKFKELSKELYEYI